MRAYLAAEGANPSRAVPFQLEAALDDRRTDSALCYFRLLAGTIKSAQILTFLHCAARLDNDCSSSGTACRRIARGWCATMSTARGDICNWPSCVLMLRTQCSRISVGIAEAACLGQFLPGQHECAAPDGTQQAAFGATAHRCHRSPAGSRRRCSDVMRLGNAQ